MFSKIYKNNENGFVLITLQLLGYINSTHSKLYIS